MLNSKHFFLFLFLCSFVQTFAQVDDHIVWAAVKVQKQIDTKTSLALTPIFRYNDDISNYQNMSIDISAKRKFARHFSTQILARTWFIPDQKIRQFLWLDLAYGRAINKIKLSTSLRFHYALDINDRKDGDFLRWKSTMTLLNFGKFKPFIAIEPWLRFNGFNDIWRMRYESGFTYDLKEQINIYLAYRREASANIDPKTKVNMYLVTVTYKL